MDVGLMMIFARCAWDEMIDRQFCGCCANSRRAVDHTWEGDEP